jgi:phosphomannomutase
VPVSANDAVDIELESAGIKRSVTKIGSPHVIKAMLDAQVQGYQRLVAWEVNGGFLLGSGFELAGGSLKALPTRDSTLPILCALLAAKEQGISLSALFDKLPQRYTSGGLIKFHDMQMSDFKDMYKKILGKISPADVAIELFSRMIR